MACKECKRRKLEQSLKEPFCTWFPKDAEKAHKELEYMDIEINPDWMSHLQIGGTLFKEK